MRIGILAGEASGDLLGAKLLQALHQQCPSLKIEGIGGPAMMTAGCHSLFDIECLSMMGFIEPLLNLPHLIKLRRDIYSHFRKFKPDVFIGIDAPDFNLGLEIKLRRLGIPVIHYVSPSVWAWRQYRVRKIAKAVDLMLTLLPFEQKFYEAHHIPVKYVGHPLAEQTPLEVDKIAARRRLCIPEQGQYIALLPGSRKQEIAYMSEPFLLAAKILLQRYPHLKFLTSHVNEHRYQEFYAAFQRHAPELPLQFFTRHSQDVMEAADIVAVTSGTATLETLLYKKPMVIAYRMSPLTYQLGKMLVKVPFVGLPNLLAEELIVPELIQDAASPEAIADHIVDYLEHPEKVAKVERRFKEIHLQLRADSANTIAESVLAIAKKQKV